MCIYCIYKVYMIYILCIYINICKHICVSVNAYIVRHFPTCSLLCWNRVHAGIPVGLFPHRIHTNQCIIDWCTNFWGPLQASVCTVFTLIWGFVRGALSHYTDVGFTSSWLTSQQQNTFSNDPRKGDEALISSGRQEKKDREWNRQREIKRERQSCAVALLKCVLSKWKEMNQRLFCGEK